VDSHQRNGNFQTALEATAAHEETGSAVELAHPSVDVQVCLPEEHWCFLSFENPG
jgi:hypothetical protein